MTNWFSIPSPEVLWLVDGLIPADGHTAICGKPKAGKSTFVRNLIAAVIKSRELIDRSIDIPPGTGRVLYVHLDRKDQQWRVAKELRQLGITEQESSRMIFRTAEVIPPEFDERLTWLKQQVLENRPHLVVIDLLWQFVVARNSNDYNATLKGINDLQDALTEVKYKGALVVTLHGRKATNVNEPFDDVLGSTGQRGSFSTNIMLTKYRKENVYTIQTDQTERDELLGEIPETTLIKNQDGTLRLGVPFTQVMKEEKEWKAEASLRRLLKFIGDHPGCEMPEILDGLAMSKKTALRLLEMATALWRTTGEGIKGDPLRYYLQVTDGDPQRAAAAFAIQWKGKEVTQ